jgi:hypothetical protein
MNGSLGHLARRWAQAFSAAPPSAADEAWADRWLSPGERLLWVQLANHDRRHAITVARRFVGARPSATRAEVAGALLHDVGKLASDLGVNGRVLATVVGPRGRRFRAYHDHEQLGASMLLAANADPVTVELVGGSGKAAAALRDADGV